MKKIHIILMGIVSIFIFGVLAFLYFPQLLEKIQRVYDPWTRPLTSTTEISNFVSVHGIPDRVCDIRAYGAKVGSDTQSTHAINAAIDDCSVSGGGVVYVPEGAWFSGGIKLKSNINLFLEEGSQIIFSTNLNDYLPVVFTRFQGIEFYNFSPLIYAKDAQNIAITGKGKFIGNGDDREAWTGGGNFEFAREKLHIMSREKTPVEERVFGNEEPGLRPSFIQFVHCKNILLDGFVVENGPIWTIHPVYSDDFVARNLTINTWSGNTDGIVIDSTKNVLIEDSHFSTGDDAISIKSGLDEDGWRVATPSENIRIRNITVEKGSSGVSIGSEMSGGVANVDVRDSVFKNARHGFRIKTTKSRGGFIKDVRVENVVMDHITGDAIDINLSYSSELQGEVTNKPVIQNIFINNIRGTGNERLAINVDSNSTPNMENVHMEDISFTASDRSISLKGAKNMSLKNIFIETGVDPMYEIENSQNISVENVNCRKGANPCFLVSGDGSRNIRLYDIDFSSSVIPITISDGALQSSVRLFDKK